MVPILIVTTVNAGDVYAIVGSSVFAASMIILYLSSTLYHELAFKLAKKKHLKLLTMPLFFSLLPYFSGSFRGAWGCEPSLALFGVSP